MGQEDILKQILEALRRLERGLPQDDSQPRSASSRPVDPRATEQFPKIELAIKAEIERHSEKCATATKERTADRINPLIESIKTIEGRLVELKKDLGIKINGVRDDATKTATGSVSSITEKVDTLMEAMIGTDKEPGLSEKVRDLGQWVEAEEKRRENEKEKSRFNIGTWLTVIGILVAIGLGLWAGLK